MLPAAEIHSLIEFEVHSPSCLRQMSSAVTRSLQSTTVTLERHDALNRPALNRTLPPTAKKLGNVSTPSTLVDLLNLGVQYTQP